MAPIQHADWKPQLNRPDSFNACAIDWSRFLTRPCFTTSCLDGDECLARKTVLITGAAGSIGSILAERLMGGLAGTLVLLDHSQRGLCKLYSKYAQRQVTLPAVEFFHVDILDDRKLQEVFTTYRPDIVFHAAAMKHLPELESDPFMALENNVLGTLRLLEMVECSGAEYFVNVSSDKAVNPTSVLGVSKRIPELLLLAMQWTALRRISVRLGNVLGSSRSFVPLFLQSLKDGAPPGITDARATRYFLAPEEAAAFLVKSIEVSAGTLLLPEMGCPRRLTELADFLLHESRADADDRFLEFTGLRDGEKLSEQLTYDYEFLEDTNIPQIHRICGNAVLDADEFAESLGYLLDLVVDRRKPGLVKAMSVMVPEFTPSATLLGYVS